jgi:hypothetical protein
MCTNNKILIAVIVALLIMNYAKPKGAEKKEKYGGCNMGCGP